MDKKKTLALIDRYVIATLGMYLSAVGVALAIISNIGTAPLSCPPYVLNLKFPSISVGLFTFIVNCSYIVIQLALLRKKFKAEYLMQIIASALFGYMIDLSLETFQWLHPGTLTEKIGLTVASCLISAAGVSLEVIANAWMLSAEMTVQALAQTTGRKFSNLKIAMDSSIVIISIIASVIFFGSPFGTKDYYVIGIGTAICAVMIGLFMKITDPLIEKMVSLRRTDIRI